MQSVANKAIHLMTALLAALLVLRSRFVYSTSDLTGFFKTGANTAILLFLVSAALSLLMGPADPGIRRLGVLEFQRFIAGCLLYFALTYQLERSDQINKVSDALVWVAGLMALLGLSAQATQAASARVDLFGNAQLFGAFLLVLFPIALVSSLTETNSGRRITAQVVSVLILCGLFASGMRSAWIALVIMLVALGLFSLIGRPKTAQTRRAVLPYIVPALTILACCAFAVTQGDAIRMISARLEAGERTLVTRKRYWEAARELYKQKPVFGVGLGAYPVFQYEFSQQGRPREAVLQTLRPGLSEMAHNLWWRIAAEQGTVGVVCFGAIFLSFWVAGGRALKELRGPRRAILLACLAGTVGVAVDALSNPGWEFAQIALFFWLVMGLGVAAMRSPHTHHREAS
jgi:O-antigen ligase